MTNCVVLDTGYVGSGALNTQTQLAVANRAGYNGSSGVNAFTLKVNQLSLNAKVSTESKPIANTLTTTPTTIVSSENPTFRVSAIMQKTLTTSGWSTNDLYQLSRLDKTRGLKLLYVDAVGGPIPTIIEGLGAINAGGNFSAGTTNTTVGKIANTLPYLLGRVKDLSIDDNPSGDKWRISFEFEVAG